MFFIFFTLLYRLLYCMYANVACIVVWNISRNADITLHIIHFPLQVTMRHERRLDRANHVIFCTAIKRET